MPRHHPLAHLATHEVTNQPPEFAGRNLYLTDTALREAALREGGDWLDALRRQLPIRSARRAKAAIGAAL